MENNKKDNGKITFYFRVPELNNYQSIPEKNVNFSREEIIRASLRLSKFTRDNGLDYILGECYCNFDKKENENILELNYYRLS